MDELTLLRKVRDDVADPTTEALREGRAALFERIGGAKPAPTHPRRGIRIAGLSALGAGTLIVALVATNVVGLPGWRGGAEPAAAEVLRSAALAAINTSDPVVGDGQFLLVATSAVGQVPPEVDDGGGSYLFQSRNELYVPADRDDEWSWMRHPFEVYETFGPASMAASAKLSDLSWPALSSKAFYDRVDALPRDPVQLLDRIYADTAIPADVGRIVPTPQSVDGEAFSYIVRALILGTMPAELRGAFYEAAARIPGVSITEGVATIDGRTGVAIGRDEGSSHRTEMIIDPTTGLYIGDRSVALSAIGEIPAGTVVGWSAVSTSVVDSAPRDIPSVACSITSSESVEKDGDECTKLF